MEKQCNVSSHSSNSKFFYVMIYYNYDVTLDLCKVFIHLDVYNKYKRRYMKDIKSNAIYRIRRCKIRKFFYVTFHFDTITMLHSVFAKYTFFFISILITTNERIYIKNLEFINFDIFASKEILRYEISIRLVFTKYISSR